MKHRGLSTRLLSTGLVLILFVLLAGPGSAGYVKKVFAQSPGQSHHFYLPVVFRQPPAPPPPNSPPRPSISYYFYMRNYTPQKAYDLGCALGQSDANLAGRQQSLVILDFGLSKQLNGVYGASGMQIGGFYTLPQVADAVKQFGIGYWVCVGSDFESHVQIGVGTNNYNDGDVYSNLSVTYGHGRAWAQMVNSINDYFFNVCARGCDGQVDAVGANDIELAWSSPQVAIDWLNGYDSANLYPLFNFGAVEGCPNACGGGGYFWTREQVWKVTNSRPVYPLPEIYLNSGVNANQWYQMSVYSVVNHGIPYDFVGTMTTWGACQQYPSGCAPIDNTPDQGWTQLYNRINTSDMRTHDDLLYSTDIQWTD